jgi:hypothetical protein
MKKIEKTNKNRRTGLKYLLIILIVFDGLCAMSQKYILSDMVPAKADTTFLIITNRKYNPLSTTGDFFTNEINDDGRVYYITVILKNNCWNIKINQTADESFETLNKGKDVVIFIHGFGYSFSNILGVSFDIKNFYDLNVISFSWASNNQGGKERDNFDIAKNNIDKSISSFRNFILLYHSYKDKNLKDVKTTLFLHSLGNYFMQKLIEDTMYLHFENNLFDNVLFNAPAVNLKNHKIWLEKMNFQKRIYVTNNKNDYMLRAARYYQHAVQLGVKAKNPLADNAIYINFTKAIGLNLSIFKGKGHNYFLGLVPKENRNVFRFYDCVLHGNDYAFSNHKNSIFLGFIPIPQISNDQ